MPNQLKTKIADLVFETIARNDRVRLAVGPAYQAFLTPDGEADLRLQVHLGPPPHKTHGERVFRSGRVWSLYRNNGTTTIVFDPVATKDSPRMLIDRTVLMNSDFTAGEMYIDMHSETPGNPSPDEETVVYPLEYPVGELLAINLLSRGRGCELHACGVALDGQGLLFLGRSGSGKSTLANLWKERPGVTLFNDDRIIVRRKGESFYMYGTPWHGDVRTSSPQWAPLLSIYFLKQEPRNYVLPLAPGEAVKRLLVASFPTFYWAQGMEFHLSFIDQLANKVSCSEFGFRPDQSSIGLLMWEAGLDA